MTPERADEVLRVIETLTVEEGAGEEPPQPGGPSRADLAEAADILGLPLPPMPSEAEDGRA
jgi:hypothetical protein